MPLFRKNHEKAKSLRQQLAEEESDRQIWHVVNPEPVDGEAYKADYWAIGCEDAERLNKLYDYHGWDVARWTDEMFDLKRRLDAIDERHPSLKEFPSRAHYASFDDALCALEKALYGFDLSGRMEKAEPKPDPRPAPEEPKAALPNPSVRIEIDPSDMSAQVTADRIAFDGGDPTGAYPSIKKAVAALDEAIADPYEIKR